MSSLAQARTATPSSSCIERVADVTDDMGVEIAANGGEVLRPVETETFSSDEEQQAWAWLS